MIANAYEILLKILVVSYQSILLSVCEHDSTVTSHTYRQYLSLSSHCKKPIIFFLPLWRMKRPPSLSLIAHEPQVLPMRKSEHSSMSRSLWNRAMKDLLVLLTFFRQVGQKQHRAVSFEDGFFTWVSGFQGSWDITRGMNRWRTDT